LRFTFSERTLELFLRLREPQPTVNRYVETFVSCLKEAVIFNVIGAAVAVGALVFFSVPLSISFGFVVLIESTGLMLIGGALGVAGGATSRKVAEFISSSVLKRKYDPKSVESSDAKAALYAITGMLLFAEGAVMAAVLS
jgi:hypothetical protein